MDEVTLTPSRIQPRFVPWLWLSLEGVDPEEVMARTGVENDVVPPPELIERHSGFVPSSWTLSTQGRVRSKKLIDHVDWIVERLSDKLNAFKEIANGARSAQIRAHGPPHKWDYDTSTLDTIRDRLGVDVVFEVVLMRDTVNADDLTYRPARAEDAASIAMLLGELGYPARAEAVPGRLSQLAEYPNTLALVAADGGEVVGVVTAHVFPALHAAEPVAWLTSMVVSGEHRSRGIGSELIERAEQWALEKGAPKISLTSALHREHAHAFYEVKQGYEKTGLRFSKALKPDRG